MTNVWFIQKSSIYSSKTNHPSAQCRKGVPALDLHAERRGHSAIVEVAESLLDGLLSAPHGCLPNPKALFGSKSPGAPKEIRKKDCKARHLLENNFRNFLLEAETLKLALAAAGHLPGARERFRVLESLQHEATHQAIRFLYQCSKEQLEALGVDALWSLDTNPSQLQEALVSDSEHEAHRRLLEALGDELSEVHTPVLASRAAEVVPLCGPYSNLDGKAGPGGPLGEPFPQGGRRHHPLRLRAFSSLLERTRPIRQP
jgi:hypothetical protein